MAKIPTQWKVNSTKNVNVPQYSSASVLYSSALVSYSSPTVGQNEQNKPSTLWTKVVKPDTAWLANPDFDNNQYAYDSGILTYDSTSQTYDGVTSGQSPIGTKPHTAWSPV